MKDQYPLARRGDFDHGTVFWFPIVLVARWGVLGDGFAFLGSAGSI